ncbi:CCA tRNA nucleotidyltransferase [Bacillus sp. FJAT-50079]|uniref:CCA tRNA nucleotidyltransferase n=1 Tax=Bacillus sp. FJAT-50079 TaxID=2833577 RepID=UPI001BCA3176|nr:CCA tRNA nucleotidyltransferase [Bacillus sp. FJAT-50079]MBS4209785.1 CCA tRNA nucleotidyltransferase [Bacillus sp. FJAT-50079]
MKQLFEKAIPLIERIENHGFEAFFVGGCVRDWLLDRPIHDVDIATSATPEEIKAIFRATVDIGIEHGTILVIENGTGFEVTTYRAESDYIDFRRPSSVEFIRSLHEDLKRRDFTMNAMAMDKSMNIIDPFHGKKALMEKRIVTVGEPAERFNEDALRLMRAVRFVSQLGFLLNLETEKAIATYAPLLNKIAIERITAEMIKLLDGDYKIEALKLIDRHLSAYLPSLFQRKTIHSILTLPLQHLSEVEMWLLILHKENPADPKDALKRWRLPTKKINYLLHCLANLQKRLEAEWAPYTLYRAGLTAALTVEKVYTALIKKDEHQDEHQIEAQLTKAFDELLITSKSELAITGKDLLEWTNKPAGPWVSAELESIERAVVSNEVKNEKQAIRRWRENGAFD